MPSGYDLHVQVIRPKGVLMNPSVSPWFSLLFLSLVCALPQSGCSRTSSQQFPLEKTKPLPEVASRDQNFSKYEPPSPFSQTAPGLFTRTVYQSDGPLGYRVEVRDLSVAAKKRVENISLHGAAFVEVLYGTGAFTA